MAAQSYWEKQALKYQEKERKALEDLTKETIKNKTLQERVNAREQTIKDLEEDREKLFNIKDVMKEQIISTKRNLIKTMTQLDKTTDKYYRLKFELKAIQKNQASVNLLMLKKK
jgi:uncharacterized phage infection (PIP) family protein YhgE